MNRLSAEGTAKLAEVRSIEQEAKTRDVSFDKHLTDEFLTIQAKLAAIDQRMQAIQSKIKPLEEYLSKARYDRTVLEKDIRDSSSTLENIRAQMVGIASILDSLSVPKYKSVSTSE